MRCKEPAAVSVHNIESPFLSHFFTMLQSLPFLVPAKHCLLRPLLPPDWSAHTLIVDKKKKMKVEVLYEE